MLEEEGDACGDEQAAEEEVELEHRLEPEGGLVTLALALALALTLTLGPRAGEGALLLTWRAPLPWQPAAPRPVRPD